MALNPRIPIVDTKTGKAFKAFIEYLSTLGGAPGGGLSDGDYGDVTVSGTGTAMAVDNNVVTNAKLADVATSTIKGRVTAGTGDPEDLTPTQVTSMLDAFASGSKGLAPASGGGTANFLRADATWASPTASVAYTAFTKDLGHSRRSGTFDITGLSGLTADKTVIVVQTGAAISSKGNARDCPEMDLILLTGFVLNSTTIRVFWRCDSVVVGTYAFAYAISG